MDFEAVWPADDRSWNYGDAAASIAADLTDMLEDEGCAAAGPPTFSRTTHHLAVRLPAVRDRADDDARPWESREAWADNDLDVPEYVYQLARMLPYVDNRPFAEVCAAQPIGAT